MNELRLDNLMVVLVELVVVCIVFYYAAKLADDYEQEMRGKL